MNKRIARLVIVALAVVGSVAYSLSGKGKLAHPRVSVMAPGTSVQIPMLGDGHVDSVRSSCTGDIAPTATKFSAGSATGLACAAFDRFTIKRCDFLGMSGSDLAVAYTGLCVAPGTSALPSSTLLAELESGTSTQVMFTPTAAMHAVSVHIDDDEGVFTVGSFGAGKSDIPLARDANQPFDLVFTCHAEGLRAYSADAYVLTDTGAETKIHLACNNPQRPSIGCGSDGMTECGSGGSGTPADSIMSVSPGMSTAFTTVGMTGSASDITVYASPGGGITVNSVTVSDPSIWSVVVFPPCSSLGSCTIPGNASNLYGVRFNPVVPGTFDVTITFTTTAPTQMGFVTVRGTAVKASTGGMLSASPTQLRFDKVPVNGSLTQLYTLKNDGTDPVNGITTTIFPGAPFTLSGAVTGVGGGSSVDGSITCSPTMAGSANGSATFNSSAGSATISLVCNTPGQIYADPVTAMGPVNSTFMPTASVQNKGFSDLMISSSSVDAPWSGPMISGLLVPSGSKPLPLMVHPTTIGTSTSFAHVFSDDPAKAELLIPLTVTAFGGTLAAAPAALDFGNVVLGSPAITPLSLINGGNSDITVLTTVTTMPSITATFPTTIPANKTLTFNVTCNPTSLGPQGGMFSFSSPDAISTMNSAMVVVTCNGIDVPTGRKLTVQPSAVATMTALGMQTGTPIGLSNPGGVDVIITSAQITGSHWMVSGTCATAGCTIPAHTTTPIQTVTVTYTPTVIGHTDPASLSFTSDDTAAPTVPLTGVGTGATLTASPTSLDFGTVAVGGSQQKMTMISDLGNVGLTTVTCSATAGYHVDLCPTSLDAGTMANVLISCVPAAPGTKSGTLTIHGTSVPDATVSLTCIGATGALIASPSSVDFGEIRVGDTTTHTKTVNLSSTGVPLTLTQQPTIATPVAGLSVGNAQTTAVTTAPDPFVVSFVAGDTEMSFSTQITAVATTSATVTATGKVVIASVDPSTSQQVDLGSWCLGAATEPMQVTLHSTGTATLHVDQPTVDLPFTLTDVTPAMAGYPYAMPPGGMATVSVLPPMRDTPGHVTSTLHWNADVDATTPVTVEYVTDASVAPKVLTYQTPAKIASDVQLVTFHNCGGAPIAISGATVDRDTYLIDQPPPQTLAPGAQGAIGVSFHPSQVGFDNATLTLTFGDGTAQTVELHGTAVGGDGTSGTPDTFYGCGCRSSDPRGFALLLLLVLRRRRCASR